MPEATKPSPDAQPLVGASEAAEIMDVELSTFSHLRRREEQTEGSKFPKPLAVLRCGPVWKTNDIKRFAAKYVAPRPGPKPVPPVKAAKTVSIVVPPPSNVTKLNGKKAAKKAPASKKVAKKVSATV